MFKNQFNETPLHYAAKAGDAEVVRALIDAGENVNAQNNCGGTPLHSATVFGHSDVVRILIEAGADVNARDAEQQKPLYYAMQYQSIRDDIMILLLQHQTLTEDDLAEINIFLTSQQECSEEIRVILQLTMKLYEAKDEIDWIDHFDNLFNKEALIALKNSSEFDPRKRYCSHAMR